MLENVIQYENKLSEMQGARGVLRKQYKEIRAEILSLKNEQRKVREAKTIVQIVAKQTQKKIEYHISNLVTMGLEAVFPDPYKFELRFEERRNRTEADLIFIKDGNEVDDILWTGGGGVADMASFILGIAVYSINPTRPIIIRDESFKFLHSPVFQEKASRLIKKISNKFKLQVILISDQPHLYKEADKILNVEIRNGISKIIEQKGGEIDG